MRAARTPTPTTAPTRPDWSLTTPLTRQDAPFVEEPSAGLVADIEATLEVWAADCGLWTVFDVLAAVGPVMELVAQYDDLVDEGSEKRPGVGSRVNGHLCRQGIAERMRAAGHA